MALLFTPLLYVFPWLTWPLSCSQSYGSLEKLLLVGASVSSHSSVTIVSCSVEGGKQYAFLHFVQSRHVHAELVALMSSVLRQVGQGRA